MYITAFFEKLYDYNHRATSEMIQLIEKHSDAFTERAQILISHTLNAHHIWNRRLKKENADYGVWQKHPIKLLHQINEENFEKSIQLLNQLDYYQSLSYTNSKGAEHQKEIGTILFHIINHSTYHRGQLMSELKKQGVTPIVLDYVFLNS